MLIDRTPNRYVPLRQEPGSGIWLRARPAESKGSVVSMCVEGIATPNPQLRTTITATKILADRSVLNSTTRHAATVPVFPS